MDDLQFFHSEEFGKLRSFLDEDGNLWFVAADVCAALDLGNVSKALYGLDSDEIITLTNSKGNPRAGIPHTFSAVSESGLYSLILRSRKPEAKAFKRWICHEVIPAIRKTGQYKNPQAVQTITVVTKPGEFVDLLSYASTLRQMARQKIYPERQRAEFLAEAASLLSGYPASRFMPAETQLFLFM